MLLPLSAVRLRAVEAAAQLLGAMPVVPNITVTAANELLCDGVVRFKLVATAGLGTYVVPPSRCSLGLCSGNQHLMVNMTGFNPGSKDTLSYSYWKYWGEIRYHERQPVYQDFLVNWQ